MFIALIIAWKKKLNLFSTYLGTVLVNPLTSSFFYFADYKVGSFLIGNNNPLNWPITYHEIKFIAKQAYIGGFIFSACVSILTYGVVYFGVVKYRQVKEKRSLNAKLNKKR